MTGNSSTGNRPASRRTDGRTLVFAEEFDGPELDPGIWLPHYLPAWSSRSETAATYSISDSCLRLSIPVHQRRWLADSHAPLRVSGVQSGNGSGPVGGTAGQQPPYEGAVVHEAQPEFAGWTPSGGYLEMRMRATISPRSMFAWWMVGLEDIPARSGEICVAEIFGDTVTSQPSAAVGTGLHPFRDPDLLDDFVAQPLPIDVTQFHTYAVDWTPESVSFFVDDEFIRRCPDPPTYPMQMMLAVFDFPDRSNGQDDHLVPELIVDHLRGYV
ncbi:glycosyl hydrolase family 16 [Williamsia limnetica]|uniref:Glycosyl hydrolase family 16 n=1 Tax=Williamsia limnetica TaxID=882452 RepID=A0A318RNL5_WILLI|nr:glycoside hydrolase family 16 protein [Williamsia limnetica]PYE17982.1 glycosyl hydrolase family 16 [Williamsia limnetica]